MDLSDSGGGDFFSGKDDYLSDVGTSIGDTSEVDHGFHTSPQFGQSSHDSFETTNFGVVGEVDTSSFSDHFEKGDSAVVKAGLGDMEKTIVDTIVGVLGTATGLGAIPAVALKAVQELVNAVPSALQAFDTSALRTIAPVDDIFRALPMETSVATMVAKTILSSAHNGRIDLSKAAASLLAVDSNQSHALRKGLALYSVLK